MTGPRDVGSAAEEAARLFAAVEDWARGRGVGTAGTPGAGTSAACGACPVCSGIALLREVKPETVEHLLDAAACLVAAVRSAVAPAPPTGETGGRPGVEHIDVRDG